MKLNEDGTCAWDNVLYPSFSDENKYMYYKYTIFPNGMIVQWGYTSFTNTETSVSKTFPIAFPNKCLCASVSTLLSDEDDTDNKRSGVDSFMQLVGYTKTDITLFRQTINNAKNISAAWIVIGY